MRTKAPRVLLIDDEPLVLEMFAYILEKNGYEVVASASAEESMSYIQSQVFDAIVTDLNLDCVDGFEIAAAARKRVPGIPIVIITKFLNPRDKSRALLEGFCFLSKPLELHTLADELGRLLEAENSNWSVAPDHQSNIPQEYLL